MVQQNLILVVDDSADDFFLLKRAFKKAGISAQLHWVPGGDEAVAYLTEATQRIPALMLLDIRMPRMDGFTVLEWLRAQVGFTAMQVFMLSSSVLEEDIEKAKALGANDYFVKAGDATEYVLLAQKIMRRWLADINLPSKQEPAVSGSPLLRVSSSRQEPNGGTYVSDLA
jgi:CheY-like chemotaxis protein